MSQVQLLEKWPGYISLQFLPSGLGSRHLKLIFVRSLKAFVLSPPAVWSEECLVFIPRFVYSA